MIGRGCEAFNVSYQIVFRANLHYLWSCNLVPEVPVCPDSQGRRDVPVRNGLIGEFVRNEVAMARGQGHTREVLMHLPDFVELEHLVPVDE